MAKAILEFDLNDPDDNMAHRRAVKSTDMAIVLHELVYNLHKRIERELDAREFSKGEDVTDYDVMDIYRQRIGELLEDNRINIDELIN
jgi:hypothetical protein